MGELFFSYSLKPLLTFLKLPFNLILILRIVCSDYSLKSFAYQDLGIFPNLLCRSSQALSGWMRTLNGQVSPEMFD